MHLLAHLRPTRWSACALFAATHLFLSACGGSDDDTSEGGSGGDGSGGDGSGGDGSGGDGSGGDGSGGDGSGGDGSGGAPTGGAASGGDSGSGGDTLGSGGGAIGACDQACSNFPCAENYAGCNDDEECRNCMHFGEGCDALNEQRLSLLQIACDCREPTGCDLQCPHEEFCAYVDQN